MIRNLKTLLNKNILEKELNVWKIELSDSTYRFAILDNVKGKSMPITFLTIFDDKNELKNAAVIKYREAYLGDNEVGEDHLKVENDAWD